MPSIDTFRTEIIPLPNQQHYHAEKYVSAHLRITGGFSPTLERVDEQVCLTFPEFFGKEKCKIVRLYGVLESKIRIVPTTLFLGFVEVGEKKEMSFFVDGSYDEIEIVNIRLEEKGVFTKSDEIRMPNGKVQVVGSVVLNEEAIKDTSLKLKIVFLLDNERFEQELSCVYLVNKEKL